MSDSARTPLLLVGLLAVLGICGLITMLLAHSAGWDRAGFLLTALPLIVGIRRWYRERPSTPR